MLVSVGTQERQFIAGGRRFVIGGGDVCDNFLSGYLNDGDLVFVILKGISIF